MKDFDFDDKVIYLKSTDNKYRYALGTKGNNTLYCFGINPSTATPQKYDRTVTKVKNIAYKKSYDSFVMFNIYPLRATNPNDLPENCNLDEHKNNIDAILSLVKDRSTIWAAWGNLINSRPWLKKCRDDILFNIQRNKNIHWVKMGNLTVVV